MVGCCSFWQMSKITKSNWSEKANPRFQFGQTGLCTLLSFVTLPSFDLLTWTGGVRYGMHLCRFSCGNACVTAPTLVCVCTYLFSKSNQLGLTCLRWWGNKNDSKFFFHIYIFYVGFLTCINGDNSVIYPGRHIYVYIQHIGTVHRVLLLWFLFCSGNNNIVFLCTLRIWNSNQGHVQQSAECGKKTASDLAVVLPPVWSSAEKALTPTTGL